MESWYSPPPICLHSDKSNWLPACQSYGSPTALTFPTTCLWQEPISNVNPVLPLWNNFTEEMSLAQWVQLGVIVPPRGYLARSGDIFDCHSWGDAAGI